MGRVEDVTLPARFLTTTAHLIATLTIVYDVVREGDANARKLFRGCSKWTPSRHVHRFIATTVSTETGRCRFLVNNEAGLTRTTRTTREPHR